VIEHHPSLVVGAVSGVATLAVPDGVVNWFEKLAVAVLVAIITGAIHGVSQRFFSGKIRK
jgi:hypothetical protein